MGGGIFFLSTDINICQNIKNKSRRGGVQGLFPLRLLGLPGATWPRCTGDARVLVPDPPVLARVCRRCKAELQARDELISENCNCTP